VRNLVGAHAADLVLLAECEIPNELVLAELNETGRGPFALVPGSGTHLRFFTRLPTTRWRFLYADPLEAWLVFRVQIGRQPAFLLVLAHLPSKLRARDTDQLLAATKLSASIRAIEREQGHDRTVVVGDLNVNPFEQPASWAGALHGVMSREVIDRLGGERTVRGEEYPFFYNPMWSVIGDRTPGPAGTYYRASSESVNYYWNTYDQVLLRPALMDRLSELSVAVSDGETSLVTHNGLPDATAGSDHLPLAFRLDW
jgi:hypothetical protein